MAVRLLTAIVACAALSGGLARAAPLTVYSSMPSFGPSAPDAADVVRGEQLALEQSPSSGVRLRALSNANRTADNWDPGLTARNARDAAEDETSIAYIGEYNSGASQISIPILNQAGILQVSPDNTYPGLTQRPGVRVPGDPDKYYPTGVRTFGRLLPTDVVQARALALTIEAEHVHRLLVVDDGDLYGEELAVLVRRDLAGSSVRTTGPVRFRGRVPRSVTRLRGDGVFFGGTPAVGPATLWRAAHRARPRAKLFGGDALADRSFLGHLRGRLAQETFITSSALPESAFPPAAAPFYAAFRARFGRGPRPYAIYGYEAMRLILDDLAAVEARPGASADVPALRDALRREFFATRDRSSVLGTYSITATGDTTLGRFGVYRPGAGGRLRLDRVVDASVPSG